MNDYPAGLPIEDIGNLISVLTGSLTGVPDRKVVAKSLWVTVGALMKLVVGEPGMFGAKADDTPVNLPEARTLTDSEAAALLQSIVHAETNKTAHDPALVAARLAAMEKARTTYEAVEIPTAVPTKYQASGILLTVLGSAIVQRQIAAIVLPFLLKKVTEWIQNGGLEKLWEKISSGDINEPDTNRLDGIRL